MRCAALMWRRVFTNSAAIAGLFFHFMWQEEQLAESADLRRRLNTFCWESLLFVPLCCKSSAGRLCPWRRVISVFFFPLFCLCCVATGDLWTAGPTRPSCEFKRNTGTPSGTNQKPPRGSGSPSSNLTCAVVLCCWFVCPYTQCRVAAATAPVDSTAVSV